MKHLILTLVILTLALTARADYGSDPAGVLRPKTEKPAVLTGEVSTAHYTTTPAGDKYSTPSYDYGTPVQVYSYPQPTVLDNTIKVAEFGVLCFLIAFLIRASALATCVRRRLEKADNKAEEK